LLGYVKSLSGPLSKVTVIHGEESSSLAFGQALQALKPQAEVVVPQPGQIVEF
jgi:predicted metal-dependent RNase